jgi:ABC-type polysaccharide/polyol phosphate export permease
MMSPKSFLGHALAYAGKDIRGLMRFKVSYLVGLVGPAVTNFGLFGTVMFGFLYSSSTGIAGLTAQNFVAFTFLGAMCSSLYTQGFGSYTGRFMNEKYWQTASLILASPLTPFELLLGVAASDMIGFSIVAILFLALSYVFFPVGLLTILLTLVFLAALYFLVAGFSLIRGALILHNENIDPIVSYVVLGTGYLSCFFFPLSFIPTILRPFAMINPVYFLVYSIRATWLGLSLPFYYPIIGVCSVVVSLLVGTYLFNRIWRNLDITGY